MREGREQLLSADFATVPIHAGSSARDGGEPAGAEPAHRAWLSRLGPGRALDAPVRKRMESTLGHDFAHVRIHDDSTAATLSRDLGAQAFTVAEHVAFAEEGYRPGVAGGDRLLAHELAHVIQQSGGSADAVTHDRSNGDAALEADADRSADGAVRSLSSPTGLVGPHGPRLRGGVRLACRPAQPAPPEPANYDVVQHTIVNLPPGITIADMKKELKGEKDAGTITSWRAEGVRPNSTEALYILYAIWQLSHTKSWDREVDLVTEIGPGKRGAITVRIDAGGNAVGVLVRAAEPTVAAVYRDVATAVTDLKARYKLSDVTGEKGRQWSVDELNKIAAALSRLSAGEAATLAGYSLIRTDDTLKLPSGTPVAGLTTTGNEVAADQLSSKRTRELRFADRVFARVGPTGELTGDAVAFVGDVADAAPASLETILHEVGHAQERMLSADAQSEYVEAQVARNRDADAATTQETALRTATTTALAGWAKQKVARTAAAKAFVAAFRAVTPPIDALRQAADATSAAPLRQAAQAAVAARDKAKDAVRASNPVLVLFAPAVTAQDAYLAATEAFLASVQAVNATKTRADAAMDPTGKISARLQRFVDFVNAKHISPITQYASSNWPANPAEFYAEAFALWRTDPKFLGSASRDLKKWFDDGEHLK